MKRASGVLLPVSSLPSKYGIGCFSKEAYKWIDQLKKAGQSYWQILPLAPTSCGDSPYQSFSSFAGNPYFIDLDVLFQKGLVTKEELDITKQETPYLCEFERLVEERLDLLLKVSERCKDRDEVEAFVEKNQYINDFCTLLNTIIPIANSTSIKQKL